METRVLKMIRSGILAIGACLMLISCATAPSSSMAGDIENVRVLVLGQDDHPAYVPRDDPAFRRVLAELQNSMHRRGFDVVDEDMIAADLDWNWINHRDKIDLMQVAKLANSSEDARNQVRAIATFSIDARRRELGYTNKYSVRVSGQIYDLDANRFLGSFELPVESFSGSACHAAHCTSDAVGDRARDIATSIGDVLATKLAHLVDDDEGKSRVKGLESRYIVTMRYLDKEVAMQIISVMAEEFPGYKDHDLIRRSSKLRKYAYVTKAPAHKLERWLDLLLVDMGLEPEEDVVLQVRDGSIMIERIRN